MLSVAAKVGDLEYIKSLIKAGVNPDSTDKVGRYYTVISTKKLLTPLLYANFIARSFSTLCG